MQPEDLFLSPDLTEDDACAYLGGLGFARPREADRLLQDLADDLPSREALAAIAGRLLDATSTAADPDAALAGFARYAAARSPKTGFLRHLDEDPRGIDILAAITGASPLLSGVLVRSPELLPWITQLVDRPSAHVDDLLEEVDGAAARATGAGARTEFLKRLQRREILRTATRDLLDRDPARATAEQLSTLQDVVIADALRRAAALCGPSAAATGDSPGLAVVATGDLGLRTLGYAGDLTLLFVREDGLGPARAGEWEQVAVDVMDWLSESVDESYRPRLDARLRRPMARDVSVSMSELRAAHAVPTSLEVRLALAQSRFVAGAPALGQRFVTWARATASRGPVAAADARRAPTPAPPPGRDLAGTTLQGPGGLEDVQRLAQVLLLPTPFPASATRAMHVDVELGARARSGALPDTTRDVLVDAGAFMRRVLNRLQLAEDSPGHGGAAGVAARSLGLPDGAALQSAVEGWQARVIGLMREAYAVTA